MPPLALLFCGAAWHGAATADIDTVAPRGVGGSAARGVDERAAPAAPARRPTGHLVAAVRPGRSVLLRASPAGAAWATVGDRTEFGSPTRLHVARVKGRWLAVSTPVRRGRPAWLDRRDPAVRLFRTRFSLHIDRSERRLRLRRSERTVMEARVGVGAPGSPTPLGRFGVTDKLPGERYSAAAYGCCILALSGHQPRLPASWQGGDRLALHGTRDANRIGAATSHGCLQARDDDLRRLMRPVPLGAPVFVSR